jgi:acyl-CoA synthetase (AMP-forming)/AMP-acid ligase II
MAYLLQQLLTESAARYPHKEAIRFQRQALSYAELDSVTNQVARALQGAGVRRGDRVGIYLHKSPASVISIFGILKAGAVYVPLDPAAPSKRLAYITRNCDIRIVLTSTEKLATLSQFFEEGTPLETAVLMDDGAYEPGAFPEAFHTLG